MKNQSGQTLIEVVAALAIASVVLGALVVVVINGLRNAKFAQNQALATKYAQDTMEEIRSMKDRNPNITSAQSGAVTFLDYLDSSSPCITNPCYFSLDETVTPLTLKDLSSGGAQYYSIPNVTGFKRLIEMTTAQLTGNNYESDITVEIQWADVSGIHNSYLQTILNNQ